MSEKKSKSARETRTPANKLFVDFLKFNNLVVILGEHSYVNEEIPETLITTTKKTNILVYYRDEWMNIIEAERKKAELANGNVENKVDLEN